MLSTRPSVAEIVDRTLRSIREPLAGFVQEMTAKAVAEGLTDQDTIDGTVNKIGYGRQIAELDTRILLKLMEKVWNPVSGTSLEDWDGRTRQNYTSSATRNRTSTTRRRSTRSVSSTPRYGC